MTFSVINLKIVAGSDDFLTSACLCWAIRKRGNLAHTLAVRYAADWRASSQPLLKATKEWSTPPCQNCRFKSTVAKLKRAQEQLHELCNAHLPHSSDLGASEIPLLHSALQQVATG